MRVPFFIVVNLVNRLAQFYLITPAPVSMIIDGQHAGFESVAARSEPSSGLQFFAFTCQGKSISNIKPKLSADAWMALAVVAAIFES